MLERPHIYIEMRSVKNEGCGSLEQSRKMKKEEMNEKERSLC